MTSTASRRPNGGNGAEEAREFWLERLAEPHEPGCLPLDRPRSRVHPGRPRSVVLQLAPEVRDAALALCGSSALLLCAALSASLVTCLRRYGNHGRVVFGSPTTGGVGDVLPIAVEPSSTTSFKDLLVLVRESLTDARNHQVCSMAQIVADLGLAPVAGREALFDVALRVAGFHDPLPELCHDVTVTVHRRNGELTGEVEYNHGILNEATVERFAGHLARVLGAGLAAPESHIDELDLLTSEEADTLRAYELGPILVADGEPRNVHGLFSAQARRSPERVAVIDGAEELTYRDLEAWTSKLAVKIRSCGVVPGDTVAVGYETSTEFVVAALAVLKTGAAYLPLDPELPPARVAAMLADAGPALAVAPPAVGHLLPPGLVHIEARSGDSEDVTSPAVAVTPRGPAYVMFTSGSSGEPKGVRMTHAALVNLLRWQGRQWPDAAGAGRILLRSAPSFDVSFQECFSALCAGGTVVVAPPESRRDVAELVRLLSAQRVQRIFLPFVLLQLVAREVTDRDIHLPNLREVITAGEQLRTNPTLVEFFRRHPDCALKNQYGPTETHVVTAYSLTGPPTRWDALPPIGTPIDNVTVSVLDGHGNRVPVGVPGEIHISGVAVADGYVNRPALSDQRFAQHAGETGQHVPRFRSGDQGRFRPDGHIEFLGRTDRQIKIRGYRVELGAVEVALLEHPAVVQAVVAGHTDEDGIMRLAAYVVATSALRAESELRGYVASRWPDYLVPRFITILDTLPLTSSGKVDLGKLPEPSPPPSRRVAATDAPRTHTEMALARVWAEVLSLELISVTDNFLDLGGDSILATQAVALAASQGMQLRIRDFFRHPTLAELAARTRWIDRTGEQRESDERDAPLLPVQHWFFGLEVPDPHLWNITVLLEVVDALDQQHLLASLIAVAAHHEALRLAFRRTPKGYVQEPIPPGQAVRVRAVDLRGTPPEELREALDLMIEETQSTINFHRGPLMTAVTVRLDEPGSSRLLLVAHHLVTDGVSWRILLQDLQTAYEQQLSGEEIRLPPRTTSYQQWARRMNEYARSEAVHAELDHWLPSAPALTRPIPAVLTADPGTERTSQRNQVVLSAADTEALTRTAPAAYGAGTHELLLTALLSSFHDWTGATKLLVELEGHGREEVVGDVDLTRTVGWFTSMFPVELTLPGGHAADVVTGVAAIKEQVRAVPERGIGHGLLRWLAGSATRNALAARPQPQVRFNYLGDFDGLFRAAPLFRPAPEPIIRMVDPDGRRPTLLVVQGHIVGDRLSIIFEHSHQAHDDATIARWVQAFEARLLLIIGRCDSDLGAAPRPEDFPTAGLDASELSVVLDQVAEAGERTQ